MLGGGELSFTNRSFQQQKHKVLQMAFETDSYSTEFDYHIVCPLLQNQIFKNVQTRKCRQHERTL